VLGFDAFQVSGVHATVRRFLIPRRVAGYLFLLLNVALSHWVWEENAHKGPSSKALSSLYLLVEKGSLFLTNVRTT
jgi:hypothetical protein